MAGIRGLTHWLGIALSARDPQKLAEFYRDLLGYPISSSDPEWVTMQIGDSRSNLAFMLDEQHEPPVWPSEGGAPSMQLHLDVGVTDLEGSVADAIALGARQAAYQPQEDVRVMLDPEGHPFCLYLDTE
ncbi:VOC family protein [Calidifontibacter sp. DB0510]|uniref:VOC family protein n=1 Tax=Metallococcus carri TaxID=1656884 RepID=A0A967B157_9MICO|nr:VOC family protein [Metallococcus carri]NHN55558.1 VOC family protein [Metallococcus carri]NOP38258.1 VOC family protein [Calidifontibacter sp. DB2511S]